MIRTMTWFAVVAAITLGLVGAAPTGAVTDVPTVVVSPAVAHVGEAVTISGVGCPQPGWAPDGWEVRVSLQSGGAGLVGGVIDPDPSGAQTPSPWTTELRMPLDEILPVTGDSWELAVEISGDWTPGAYVVSAFCKREFAEDGAVAFAGAELLVEEAPAATTTTAPHPPSPPSPPSPPAAPVPESPAFTG